MTDALSRVTDAVLVAEYGAETVGRARSYAHHDCVGHVQVVDRTDTGSRVLATVDGSAVRPYSVLLTVTVDDAGHGLGWDVDVWSRCSCPVGDQCKHGAAVAMLLAAEAQRREDNAWETALTAALTGLTPPPPGAATTPQPVGLRVEMPPAPTHRWSRVDGPARVTLRLVTPGRRGQWVKTGIRWTTLASALTAGSLDPGHLEALRGLYAGLLTAQPYYAVPEDPDLAAFGPMLWPGLVDAMEAGVALVPGARVRSVALAAAPLEVAADVVATDGGARLDLGVEHDDRLWSGTDLTVVGRPGHGVVLIRHPAPEADLLLAPLLRPAPSGLGDLLTAPEPVQLPAHARSRWEHVLLPRLGRSVRLVSSDGSVEIRSLPRPRLRLTVEWGSATAAALTWEWVYGEEPTAPTCLLDSPIDLDGLRDPATEAETLERLTAGGAWPRRPVATDKVTGPPALALALELLPTLAAAGPVEVVQIGRPDFRASDAPVEVRFDTWSEAPGDDADDGPVDWLDLWVAISVEGETVPLPDLLAALTRGDEHLVLPSGLILETSRPEFETLRELVRAAAEIHDYDDGDHLRIDRHDLGTVARVGDAAGAPDRLDPELARWVRRAQALRDLVDLPTPEPTGIVSTLRDYQRQGFHWLVFLWETGLGGVLADDMGLGKTLQVLALIAHARAHPVAGRDGPFLVVAPTSVVTAWRSEAERHAPDLRVRTVGASSARRLGITIREIAADADVVVTTYTLLRLEAEQYADVAWAGLILDEAQQVKNHTGKTYRAARGVPAPFRLAVTGTPFENRLLELWSLLSITTPGLYPTAQAFSRQVVRPVEKDRDRAALSRFRARIKPFMLRRTKELVAPDLPPKQEQVLEVALSPRHRRVYDTHLQRERQKILGLMDDFDKNRVAILSALTRLRQLALDPGLVDPEQTHVGSAKLDLLVGQLAEVVAEGHQALVFSQFTSYLSLVRDRLDREGVATCYLDGGTRDRAAVIDDFRSGEAPVFLISLKAGGVGLTLTEADYVYVLDPWWNPASEAQAVDRAHRIGQQRPVMVYRLVSSDTIEEKVMALKARKAELFAQVVDGDGLLAEAITADDVRALVD